MIISSYSDNGILLELCLKDAAIAHFLFDFQLYFNQVLSVLGDCDYFLIGTGDHLECFEQVLAEREDELITQILAHGVNVFLLHLIFSSFLFFYLFLFTN